MTNPIPEGYPSVTPYLIVNDAAGALEFYKRAFKAEELFRMPMPDGRIGHAEIKIGTSPIMLADEYPELGYRSPASLGGSGVNCMLYVPDVDETFNRALAEGATELQPLKNQFYGDRSGVLRDPYGHIWVIATHIEDVSPEEMQRRSREEDEKAATSA
jgi:PhnB protein